MRFGVALIAVKLNAHAFLPAYLESLHSPQQFSTFPCEHGANYQFNSAPLLLFSQFLQVKFVLMVLDRTML